MDSRQKAIARMARQVANEWIGGLENDMLDNEPGDEAYENAKHDLELGHETWVRMIVAEVKDKREVQKHLKFAGNAYLESYVDGMLKTMGY